MDFINNDYKYSELTGKIIGAAMQVHNYHGIGFPEIIYQNSLAIEMDIINLLYEKEKTIKIYYKNFEAGNRRIDFIVENLVSVELKAVSSLEPVHYVQALNYLEAFNLEVGLLINFGAKKLEWKRLINTVKIKDH